MTRCLRKQWFRDLNRHGFTLVEIMVVIGVIGVLAAIAIPLYSSIQARSRVAKAQGDLRGLYSAVTAFNAHCGDVPAIAGTYTPAATLTFVAGASTCAAATAGNLTLLGNTITDPNLVTAGPFYTGSLTPPPGWQYNYSRTGPANFTLVTPANLDAPAGLSFP